MASITKKIMIQEVAAQSKVNQPTTKAVWNAFVDVLTKHLVAGDKVAIDGFGTFDVSELAERPGRNPITGEAITVKARKNPKLKFGKDIKDALNGRS